ncbi:hypothetical protein CcCBS67573_g00274 [Chytriomyces confervae]|uniref:Uncharacterized protein n=1 Tax=Chytriomyces confervae TaxID=246404 RepID=A0A507FS93_9FUNG|nr:hypothetical protein CcCBS67573_g00274 [Chytriomyces confervae]
MNTEQILAELREQVSECLELPNSSAISVNLLDETNALAADSLIVSAFEHEPLSLSCGKPAGLEDTDGLPYCCRNTSVVVAIDGIVVAAAATRPGQLQKSSQEQGLPDQHQQQGSDCSDWVDRVYAALDGINEQAARILDGEGVSLAGSVELMLLICLTVEKLARLHGYQFLYSHSNALSAPRQLECAWRAVLTVAYKDMPRHLVVNPLPNGHVYFIYTTHEQKANIDQHELQRASPLLILVELDADRYVANLVFVNS